MTENDERNEIPDIGGAVGGASRFRRSTAEKAYCTECGNLGPRHGPCVVSWCVAHSPAHEPLTAVERRVLREAIQHLNQSEDLRGALLSRVPLRDLGLDETGLRRLVAKIDPTERPQKHDGAAGAVALRTAAEVLEKRADQNLAAGPAWREYAMIQRSTADWLRFVADKEERGERW